MRLSLKYIVPALALILTISCEDSKDIHDPDENETVIETPEYGYIFFDGQTATRGTLVEPEVQDDRLKSNFGVIGYTHTYSDWVAAEPQAKPNVFTNHPQKVVWNPDDQVHTYEPIQAWLGQQLYAFFAFYPSDLVVSGSDYEGNPYIDFTFQRNNLEKHVDVMTAHSLDDDYRTRSVSFNMRHRLSALDILANNLYEEYDEVRVTSMSITINNLLFDKVRIPLNMRDEPDLDYYAGTASNTTATYDLNPESVNLSIFDQVNTPLTSSASNTTMILIPQDLSIDTNQDGTPENGTINGNVKVAYQLVNNGTVVSTVAAKDYPFTINRDLLSGYRYYIQLNFAAGDVTIAILESNMWSATEVKYEFE